MDARTPEPNEEDAQSPAARSRRLTRLLERVPLREEGRGRLAETPFEIGFRGWIDILTRLAERVGIDNLGLVTAGVTFYLFLALIPAMIAVATFYGISADTVTLSNHVDFLSGYLPQQALAWIEDEFSRVTHMRDNGLSLTFALSLGLSFWAMNNAVIALFGAMNVAYGEVEKRSLVALYLRGFAVTGSALVLGLAFVGIIVGVPLLFDQSSVGLDYGGRRVTAPVMFIVVALSSAAIFRLGPSRRPARWRWIMVGAVVVALGWIAASTLLSWYLSNVADYSRLYGSLGTIVALMFWFYISVFILLLGAEFNAEVEHQTMVDTTVGPPQPPGRRGAYVADTVGKTSTWI